MQTRPFLPGLFAKLFGEQRASLKQAGTAPTHPENSVNSVHSVKHFSGNHRTRQRLARSPGVHRFRKVRQTLTDPKFMHRSQRARFTKGETIFV